jgi:hypothetical protein
MVEDILCGYALYSNLMEQQHTVTNEIRGIVVVVTIAS